MSPRPATVADDLATLKAAFLAERSARLDAEARASGAEVSMPIENSPKVPGENSLVGGVGDQPAC